MATSEAQPDSGTKKNDGLRSEREVRWQAREIVRGAFEVSPRFEELVEQTMTALREVQKYVDAQITWGGE